MANDTHVVSQHAEGSDKGKDEVTITINDTPYDIHRGRQTVAYLKELGGVSQNFELDEVENGQLVPLDDNGAVTIKGGEVFKSNLKIGHSA